MSANDDRYQQWCDDQLTIQLDNAMLEQHAESIKERMKDDNQKFNAADVRAYAAAEVKRALVPVTETLEYIMLHGKLTATEYNKVQDALAAARAELELTDK